MPPINPRSGTNYLVAGFLAILAAGIGSAVITSLSLTTLTITEQAVPSLSTSGKAVVYADSTSHTLQVSNNGGAFGGFGGGGGAAPFDQNGGIVKGHADATKIVAINADTNVPTATTVTLTAPAADGTIATAGGTLTSGRLVTGSGTSVVNVTGALATPDATSTYQVSNADNTKNVLHLQTASGAAGGIFALKCTESTGAATLFSVGANGACSAYSLTVTNGAFMSLGGNATFGNSQGSTNILSIAQHQLTAGTITYSTYQEAATVNEFNWTNTQIAALSGTANTIKICTLPSKTVVVNAYVIITGAATFADTLTVSMGRTSASYIDYTVASDAKAAANTVYGDASGERGTNLTGYDLPSWTATTDIFLRFNGNATNLSTVTTCTGTVVLVTQRLK